MKGEALNDNNQNTMSWHFNHKLLLQLEAKHALISSLFLDSTAQMLM